jgi:hypothetical protein
MTLIARAPCGNSRAFGGGVQVKNVDRAGLGAAVADLPVAQPGLLGPGQPGQRLPQRRLVALDGEQIVGAPAVQVLGGGGLAVQRIGGDHDSAQLRHGVQHGAKVASSSPPTTSIWGERQMLGVVEDRDQLDLLPALAAGAAQGVAQLGMVES